MLRTRVPGEGQEDEEEEEEEAAVEAPKVPGWQLGGGGEGTVLRGWSGAVPRFPEPGPEAFSASLPGRGVPLSPGCLLEELPA